MVARARAPAKATFKGLKEPTNRVERRIETLIGRVTYKTTTQPKLNRGYSALEGLNPLSQTVYER
jgi:hypothetical protein